jgi:lipopolysaccharide/colanic/teichoic acid biosynthesis glycosyltransferase
MKFVQFVAFFPQEIFSTLLSLERKRAERSGNPFALALLETTSPSLRLDLRATDVAGWYEENRVLGIIFTALNGAPISVIRSTLTSKIEKVVQGKIPYKLLIYPEDIGNELYPDKGRRSSFHKVKRGVDIAGSLLAIVVLSPVFLAISLLVKLSSPGPVLFRQKRLGLLGGEFDFLKFRTMYINNDPSIHKEYVSKLIEGKQNSPGVYKIQKDPRVTRIGRFLRRSSLDELPQFINVLKGEMSLVGPRPPIRYEMEKYRSWHKRRVLEVKPGITGLWQVAGRSRTTFDEMVRLDIQYILEQSPWLDLKIVLRTPAAILLGTGAY